MSSPVPAGQDGTYLSRRPRPRSSRSERALERLPVQCQLASTDQIDWSTSEVRAFPLLSGTDWESWYPPDKLLGVRVERTKLVETVGQKRTPKSVQELDALSSWALRWLYDLLPPPSPFEARINNWAREREQAKRILAQRDREKPAARTQALGASSTYLLDWEPLPSAVARLMAVGVKEDQAKLTLCQMIVDRRVAVRLTVAKGTSDIAGMFVGPNIKLPIHLKPNNLDWEKSRPLKPWSIGPYLLQRFSWKSRPVALIEVRTCDIIDWTENLLGQASAPMPSYGGGDRHRYQQAKQWRAERIKRFNESQRSKREWINFAEIAEWCSELGGSVVPDESARASAYEKLHRDLLDGDFEMKGRTHVLYLHPSTAMARMTRGRMLDLIEAYPPASIQSEYLDHCWLPRNSFGRWLAKHHLPNSPPRFEPKPSMSAPVSTRTAGQARKGPTPGAVDRFGESDRALFPEIERIMRESHKSVHAAALEVASAGKVQGGGTPESLAKRLAKRFRRERLGLLLAETR
jgi:hypothetical protein